MKSKVLFVALLIELCSCASTKSFYVERAPDGAFKLGRSRPTAREQFYNDRAPVLSPWSGRYSHVSGKFELRVQQFAKDLLAADIIKVPDTNQRDDIFASFFAVIKNDIAISEDRTDPDCRLELKRRGESIEFFDFCHPVGDQNLGLYRPATGEVASKRVMQ
jgi:hypothetical protein